MTKSSVIIWLGFCDMARNKYFIFIFALSHTILIIQELFHNLNFVCLNFLTPRILKKQEKSQSFVLKYLLPKSEWLIA